MSNLTLGSLFDGSGGFPFAGHLCGITPVWSSEIEPFPVRVTEKRLPDVKHYGDITKLNGADLEPVDIITFGSPCQDMSIAGKRDGLGGSRSNLFFEAVRIIKEMRCATNGKYPRYTVWENVCGAFSSNKGEDFRCVLETLCKVKDDTVSIPQFEKWKSAGEIVGNGYSLAWRTIDAQFWGVPQRRRRIFLVTDFGGSSAGKVLFESESVSGHFEKSKIARQGTAGSSEKGSGATICLNDQGGERFDITENMTSTLRAESHHSPCVLNAAVFENHSQDTRYTPIDEVSPTVSSTYGTGGNNRPLVVENIGNFDVRFTSENTKNARHNVYPTETARTLDTGGNPPDSNQGGVAVVAYGICSKDSNSMKSGKPACDQDGIAVLCIDQGGGKSACSISKDVSPTLACTHGGEPAVCVQGSMIGRADKNGPQGSGVNENVSFTLNATDKHAVAYGIDRAAFNQGANAKFKFSVDEEKQPTIVAKGAGAVAQPTYCTSKNSHHTIAEKNLANTLVATDYKDPPIINQKYIVRRLTPTECARLQGFPDGWCADLSTENPTAEEILRWRKIFNEYNAALGKKSKPKTEKQVRKWLKNPYSDSAAYKMWGNGVALPCVVFILAGIVWCNNHNSGYKCLCNNDVDISGEKS